MLDIKALNTALTELGSEKKISPEKVLDAVEKSLAAAYQKEYGKRGQLVRCVINTESGETIFEQVKLVVDETTVRMSEDDEDQPDQVAEERDRSTRNTNIDPVLEEGETIPRYNEERHMLIADARLLNKNVTVGEEIVFPLDNQEDFGRIAAQTAKQVIVQKLREAERESITGEFSGKLDTIVTGTVQRVDRGTIFVDLGRMTGVVPFEEQIPQERYAAGERINVLLYAIDENPKGLSLKLSRTHPKFLIELFKQESTEIASGTVEIVSVSREAGSRSKIAVRTLDDRIDPVGACVGQRGARVTAITNELSGEKIDIILYDSEPRKFIASALSPAKAVSIEIYEEEKKSIVTVAKEEQSLAIGRGGQNVRLAAKLVGWKIDIIAVGDGPREQRVASVRDLEINEDESIEEEESEMFENLSTEQNIKIDSIISGEDLLNQKNENDLESGESSQLDK